MAGVLHVTSAAAEVKLATVAALATGKGRLHDPYYATVDYAGRCDRPIIIDRVGVGHALVDKPIHTSADTPSAFEYESGRTLSMQVRCRKCEACMKQRRREWTERAAKEWKQSSRTWFCTLTLAPGEHYKLMTRVRLRLQQDGVDLDALAPAERLSEVLRDYRHEMDKWLMRIRTGLRQHGWDRVRLRYLWVPEPHKNGLIHFHALVHEVPGEMPLTKRRIEEAWPFGFTQVRLVKSEAAARYVTKYLGKHHFDGRIRASQFYGRRDEDPAALLARVPFPGVEAGQPPKVLPQSQAEMFAELRAELGRIPGDDVEEVDEGGEIAACPTGLHFGVRCTCAVHDADDPFGIEAMRPRTPDGVPRRKWMLRGWHQPTPRRAS